MKHRDVYFARRRVQGKLIRKSLQPAARVGPTDLQESKIAVRGRSEPGLNGVSR
jgi:hypothetical protein